MQKRDVTFHSFIIAPKSLERVFSKNISQSYDNEKKHNRAEYPGKLGPVRFIPQGEHQIAGEYDFDYEPENKSLAGYKRKKKRRAYDERHERDHKKARQYGVSQIIV
jgi:hypothetical protein